MGKVSNVSPRAHIRRCCARQPSVSGLLSTPTGRGWPFFPPRRGGQGARSGPEALPFLTALGAGEMGSRRQQAPVPITCS